MPRRWEAALGCVGADARAPRPWAASAARSGLGRRAGRPGAQHFARVEAVVARLASTIASRAVHLPESYGRLLSGGSAGGGDRGRNMVACANHVPASSTEMAQGVVLVGFAVGVLDARITTRLLPPLQSVGVLCRDESGDGETRSPAGPACVLFLLRCSLRDVILGHGGYSREVAG